MGRCFWSFFETFFGSRYQRRHHGYHPGLAQRRDRADAARAVVRARLFERVSVRQAAAPVQPESVAGAVRGQVGVECQDQ